MSTIVIMPGGFHPFHAGHYALYQSALKAFPGAEVYVAATNDQSERPFPFSLKEKLAKLAGVKQGHFVQVKSPFRADEITSHYNPNEDVLIFVRSEKDKNESPKPGGTKKDGTPAYFQPWTGKDVQPFAKHAYFAYLPTVEFGPGITSATQIRKAWPTLNDKRKLALVMSLYPAAQKNPKLAQTVAGMFDQVMGGQVFEEEMPTRDSNIEVRAWAREILSKYDNPHFINDIKNQRVVARGADERILGVFNRVANKPNIFIEDHDIEESEQALQFATQAHAGQTRAGGEPYVNHPIRVADSIKQYKQSHNLDALIDAALLHDTVEDTDTTHEALHDLFGGLVASLVKELTSDPEQIKKMGKAQYLAHKMAAMSSYALVIKLADRLDNVKDITTARTPEWRQKYKKETEHILNYIEKTRALSDTHKIFIDLIRNKISELNNPETDVAEGSAGVGVRSWANKVRKDHGADVKFWNRKEGGGAVDSVIAKNSNGEVVGVYNRKTGYPTVFEPKQGMAEEKDEMFMHDPESEQLVRYAQQHYANAPTKQQAFVKFVQRALKHSEEEDNMQDDEIKELQQDVDKIKQVINKLQVSESTDYIEEK